jgi:shikimate dehydrogenase
VSFRHLVRGRGRRSVRRVHVAALIGSPVAHSLSPVIHQAAFDAAGVDWRYVAFDVPAGRADEALAAMRALRIAGLSVTTPHKEQVADGVDGLAPAAATLRSVNTVVCRADGQLVGHSTDGQGFVAALHADGVDVCGMHVAVLGAGPAARSVVAALDHAGAVAIVVINRTQSKVPGVVALAPLTARAAGRDVAAELSKAELIVNATSAGFASDDVPLDPAVLHPEHLVADLVYHPLETALLRAARDAGARTFDGLGMLVHQAALQQQLWLGHLPDVTVMRAAAEAELNRRAVAAWR